MKAVILAAGVGHRFKELTKYKNKAFFTIGQTMVIKQIIQYLLQAGIRDITIVTGHRHEDFSILKKNYPIHILYNTAYGEYNNIHSLALIAEQLNECWLIHGDTVLFENIFKEAFTHTTFYTMLKRPNGAPVRVVEVDEQHHIQGFHIDRGERRVLSLLGVSYWRKDAQMILLETLNHLHEKEKKRFDGEWEELLQEVVKKVEVDAYQLDRKYGGDLNTMKDYQEIVETYDRYWKSMRK